MAHNILLVNPWIYDFAAYDFWNKPIGILSLASFLRMNGMNVFFLDCLDPYHPHMTYSSHCLPPKRKISGAGTYAKEQIPKPTSLKQVPRNYNRYGIRPEIFIKSAQSLPKPDLIMITSMMTYWYPAVFDTVKLLHQTFPGIPIVLGGNYVTLNPEHAASSGADFSLSGPGELSLPLLLKHLYNRDMTFLPDKNLDSYPYPAFDLVHHPDQLPIMTSRGCPFRCSYCASHLLNEGFQRRDPIRVVDEIEYWHTHLGINHFSFYDDALLIDPSEMAIPLLSEIIRRDLPLAFHCPNGLHLREITPGLGQLIFKAGFKTLRFGLETSNVLRQTVTGGKVDNEEFKEAVVHLQRAGYRREEIGVYLLCGLPGQPADEVRESIHFVQSTGARPIIAEYSPIPGTGLWNAAIAASPYPIADEPLFQNNSLLPCRNESLTYEMYQNLKLMTRKANRALKTLDK
ncbi:MAG: B12-binding domain-containing radical SAM protein [Syntrophales bacterium]